MLPSRFKPGNAVVETFSTNSLPNSKLENIFSNVFCLPTFRMEFFYLHPFSTPIISILALLVKFYEFVGYHSFFNSNFLSAAMSNKGNILGNIMFPLQCSLPSLTRPGLTSLCSNRALVMLLKN